MQGFPTIPTEDDAGSIPTECVRNGPNLNCTFTVRRRAAKRTVPGDLPADEIQLALPRPQDEDEDPRETQRPRLEEPFPTSTNEATRQNTSHSTAVALTPDTDAAHLADAAVDQADSDPVMDMHPKVRATTVPRHWTHCKVIRIDSAVVAVLVPGQASHSGIDPTSARTGKWRTDEDTKLTDAVRISVRTFGSENWLPISTLVPGRTSNQCRGRWNGTLAARISRTTAAAGPWTADEDKKLREVVPAHGEKNWKKVAALVPGRTQTQCSNRWYDTFVASIDPSTTREWTADEDDTLKDVVHKHEGKNWPEIGALLPGRTKEQCHYRWHTALRPIGWVAPRAGYWTTEEDIKLKDAVQMFGGKNWDVIAGLVPGRTSNQCSDRWRDAFLPPTI
jgi:hypothetical protein